MALVAGHMGIRFVDESGETTSMPLYFSVADATTLAAVAASVSGAAAKVQAVSGAEVTKLVMVFEVPVDFGVPAIGDSRIESTGLFKAIAQDGFTRSYGVDVPAINPAVLLGTTKTIDMQNAAVQTLVAELEGSALGFTNPSGSPIISVTGGRQTFRKHRRIANRA